jgi:hypothetical protein
LIEFVDGKSTTNLINQIQKRSWDEKNYNGKFGG